MHIDGECFCGAVAYEADLVSPEIGLCHCSDCQAFSGSPYRATVEARSSDFKVTRGEARAYVKTGSSGGRSAQYFCATCGSNLYRIAEGEETVGIRIGTIRQRHQLTPARQTWIASGLGWAQDIRALKVTPPS